MTDGWRALVVEDDRAWQEILGEVLHDAGLVVDAVCCHDDAVARLRSAAYRLAVVDLSLAHGDSLRSLQRLRARCPGLKVIVLSVHDEPSVCRAAMEAGADGFVLKRALATELLPAVDTVLAGRRYGFPIATEKA